MAVTEQDLINLFRNGTTAELNDAIAKLTEQYGKRESERIYDRALKAYDRETEQQDGPVHTFFSFSYSSYQVVPRVLAQSMPHEWQARFVQCMEEMQAAFGYLGDVDYEVQPAVEKEISDLSDAELDQVMERLGITVGLDSGEDVAYFDRDGNELRWDYRVLIHVPDPLPPYSRGRTRVPRADQLPVPHSCPNCEGVDPQTCTFNKEEGNPR